MRYFGSTAVNVFSAQSIASKEQGPERGCAVACLLQWLPTNISALPSSLECSVTPVRRLCARRWPRALMSGGLSRYGADKQSRRHRPNS